MAKQYAVKASLPDWIQRAKNQTLTLSVYIDSQIVTPTAGTFTLIDPSGTHIVDAAVVTITDSVATYSLLSTQVPATMSIGEGWIEVWALTIDGIVTEFKRQAALCLTKLHPVVTDDDILEIHSTMDIVLEDQNNPTFQKWRDQAFNMIQRRLMRSGKYPYLILSPHALFDIHLFLTLHLICMDATTEFEEGNWTKLSDKYRSMYEDQWKELTLTYDYNKDGDIDGPDELSVPANPVIFLGGAPSYSRYLGRY